MTCRANRSEIRNEARQELQSRGGGCDVNKALVDAQLDLEEHCDGRLAKLSGNVPLSYFCCLMFLLLLMFLAGCQSSTDKLKNMGSGVDAGKQMPAGEVVELAAPSSASQDAKGSSKYWPEDQQIHHCMN